MSYYDQQFVSDIAEYSEIQVDHAFPITNR